MVPIDYYGIRRLSPYLGIIQVVDAGRVRAFSTDGTRWQVRRVSSDETPGTSPEISAEAMRAAIDRRPPMPFPQRDRFELWLLDRSDHQPLALLKSAYWRDEVEQPVPASQCRFIAGEGDFRTRHPCAHPRQRLEGLVNGAARPRPRAQWFQRTADGGGIGRHGTHLDPALEKRVLGAEAFPGLIVREAWATPQETALVEDFHRWFAAFLLTHQCLSPPHRARLEAWVKERPDRLLDTYPLIPEVHDARNLRTALVAARLLRGCTG